MGTDEHPTTVPAILVALSGEATKQKLDLANRALVDWQVRVKKVKKLDKNECPFLQPSTQNMELRCWFSMMKDKYDFRFKISDFMKFNGSLGGVMKALYQKRVETWVSK